MSLTYAEPRLAPLGNTFLVDEKPRAQKRSHSFSGYVTYHQGQSLDAPEPEPSTRRCGGASQVAAECVCVASDASTYAWSSPTEFERAESISEKSTSELWPDAGSDREEHVRLSCSRGRALAPVPSGAGPGGDFRARAESISEKSTSELWPDTDSDKEEHVRLSCSRGRALAPAPSGAGPGGDFRAPSQIVATALSSSPQFPVPPGPCWLGSQVSRNVVNSSSTMPPSPCPCWFGGQVSRIVVDSSCVMRAAEMALAALEEAEVAVEETAAVAVKETSTAAGGGNAARMNPQARKDNMGKKITTDKQGKANRQDPLPKGVTSLMLHGIPFEMTQRSLLEEINRDFAGRCDFCYMPCDFISGANRGQAFVNFTSHGAAAEFHSAWRRRPTSTGHVLNISVAAQQGLAAQMAIWSCPRLRRVRNPNFRPFVLSAGAGF